MENYECLISFLDKLFNQGNMKFQTARTRKTAIKKVFKDSGYTKENIMTLDLDKVIEEFKSKNHLKIKDETIDTYKSRIRRTIEDYIRIEKLGDKPKKEYIKDAIVVQKKVTTVEVQCPIRGGEFIIDIKNLPINLSSDELIKVMDMIKLVTN